MRHPDSILPLLIALAIAVVLHAALLPVGATMLSRSQPSPGKAELNVTMDELSASVLAGHQIDATFKFTNTGTAEVKNWEWELYWSTDRKLDDEDQKAMQFQAPLNLPGYPHHLQPGETLNGGLSGLHAPENYSGPFFLIAAVWGENAARATAATAVWIDSGEPAEIEISGVDASPQAYAGGSMPLAYVIRNRAAAGWALPGWKDRVILSADEVVSDEDLVLLNVPQRRPLAPGQSRDLGPFELHVPLGVEPGDYHLIVTSDGPSRSVTGLRSEADERQVTLKKVAGWSQTFVAPLRIEPATHPDLAPRNIKLSSGENQITVGEPTVLHFDVVNRSPLAAPDLLWGDRVYWSADDEVSDDDVMLISQPRGAYPGELPGGGAYRSGPHDFVISPEMVLSPTMYLIVVADDENDIAEGDYEGNNALAMPIVIKQEVEAEKPDELKLGRDDEPARVTVAWIAHDDFQELLARESVTLQPILQDKVDPTPNAPLERDPEDTGNPAVVAPPPAPPTPNPANAQTPASRQTADTSVDPVDTDNAGELPNAAPGAVDQTGDSTQDSPGIAQPNPTPPQSPPESPPTVASQEQGEKPTSAPRSDREVDPTTLIQAKSVRPGQVLVGPGIEIKTFRPQWSAAARFALPRNPKVVITFDPDGTVLEAAFITSTGFDNVDGPLLSSLYRWKATGKSLQEITKPFPIELTILLGDSDPPEEEKKEEGGS